MYVNEPVCLVKEKYGFLLSVSEYNFCLLPALVESNVKCAPNRKCLWCITHCMAYFRESRVKFSKRLANYREMDCNLITPKGVWMWFCQVYCKCMRFFKLQMLPVTTASYGLVEMCVPSVHARLNSYWIKCLMQLKQLFGANNGVFHSPTHMVLAKLTTGVDVFSDWIIAMKPTSASSSVAPDVILKIDVSC